MPPTIPANYVAGAVYSRSGTHFRYLITIGPARFPSDPLPPRHRILLELRKEVWDKWSYTTNETEYVWICRYNYW